MLYLIKIYWHSDTALYTKKDYTLKRKKNITTATKTQRNGKTKYKSLCIFYKGGEKPARLRLCIHCTKKRHSTFDIITSKTLWLFSYLLRIYSIKSSLKSLLRGQWLNVMKPSSEYFRQRISEEERPALSLSSQKCNSLTSLCVLT